MTIIARLSRSLPLLLVLAVLALAVYLVVSARRSPNRAKEVLFNLFTVLGAVLTVFFASFTAYAWLESNVPVLELFGAFAAVTAAVFVAARISRRVFIKNHPDYPLKPWRLPRFPKFPTSR